MVGRHIFLLWTIIGNIHEMHSKKLKSLKVKLSSVHGVILNGLDSKEAKNE